MNDEAPFPPVLPAVVPSPIGPAISYSNIRAVTSRAQSLVEQLDKKIRKPLHSALDAVGNTGAKLETKVVSRLADQINPVEQLHNDTVTLLQNQLAAGMAPAITTLEDLAAGDAQASQSQPPAAGTTTRAVGSANGGSTSQVVTRTATITSVPVSGLAPAANLCTIPDRATVVRINVNAQAIANSTSDPGGVDLGVGYYGFGVDCCWKSTIGSLQALRAQYPNDWSECLSEVGGIDYGPGCKFVIFQLTGTAKQQQAGFAYLKQQMDPQGLGDKPGQCGITPIDCKTHPFDPSCPPDCINHPEDPRCKPPPTCPPPCAPPCIEVNVPPCPPCPPLNIPTCVQIDLCDWEKFCKALHDCLVTSKQDCALDNEEAYVLDDCQGQLGQAQKFFFDTTADQFTKASTVAEAVQPSTLQQNQFIQVFRVGRNLLADRMPV